MSTPVSAASPRRALSTQGVLVLIVLRLLECELWRLERRMNPVGFDATLSAQIDRVRTALEVLR